MRPSILTKYPYTLTNLVSGPAAVVADERGAPVATLPINRVGFGESVLKTICVGSGGFYFSIDSLFIDGSVGDLDSVYALSLRSQNSSINRCKSASLYGFVM